MSDGWINNKLEELNSQIRRLENFPEECYSTERLINQRDKLIKDSLEKQEWVDSNIFKYSHEPFVVVRMHPATENYLAQHKEWTWTKQPRSAASSICNYQDSRYGFFDSTNYIIKNGLTKKNFYISPVDNKIDNERRGEGRVSIPLENYVKFGIGILKDGDKIKELWGSERNISGKTKGSLIIEFEDPYFDVLSAHEGCKTFKEMDKELEFLFIVKELGLEKDVPEFETFANKAREEATAYLRDNVSRYPLSRLENSEPIELLKKLGIDHREIILDIAKFSI